MKHPLRSAVCTEGRRMAGARALWVATGMKHEQFGKPIIAVVNSFTQFVPGTDILTRRVTLEDPRHQLGTQGYHLSALGKRRHTVLIGEIGANLRTGFLVATIVLWQRDVRFVEPTR